MNVWLQIGVGLLPGCIVAIILFFRRKAFNFNKILITLLLTLGCGALLYFGISDYLKDTGLDKPHVSQKKMMALANALVEKGAYEDAEDVIDEYSDSYGYDDECRLLKSRMALLEGDYDSASHLYQYLCDNTKLVSAEDNEVLLANLKSEKTVSDLVLLDYIKSSGKELSDYGYEEADYEAIEDAVMNEDDLERTIRKAIENQYSISEEVDSCASAVADLAEFEVNTLDESEDGSTSKYKRAFSDIEDHAEELLTVECVKKAQIKAHVIAGDYAGIAENINADSDYHELMIAAELYMSGLISKSDFSDEYQNLNRADVAAIKNRLRKILNNYQKDASVQEKKALKSRIDAISKQLNDPALVAIKEQLIVSIEIEAGPDRTKVYLEIAKIEDFFGNESSTDDFLSEAIYSSQDNKDDSYVHGMAQIIDVLDNDGESTTDNIKNVSEYVDVVLDHSLTVDVEKIVSPQYNPNTSDSNQNYDYDYDDEDRDRDRDKEKNKKEVDFAKTATDYVSRKKSSISIGKIDTGNFEEITARVQIDSDSYSNINELKNALKVYDCGTEITDFTIKKINYTGSNIMLVCDVSGSMMGSIGDLTNAIETFVNDKNAGEKLSVVTFDSAIVETKPFGTSDEELISFAQSLSPLGGTDMFSATVNCLGSFPSNADESNVLILMSDGQDNNPRTPAEIVDQIGGGALKKGVTVYAVGLGYGVDTGYLSTIADSGNGDFIYVSDSTSLAAFYDLLHAQVYSQYEITYKAKDTMTTKGRTLEVNLPAEKARDVKVYSLKDATDDDEEDDDDEDALDATSGLSVSGFSPRYLYKGLQDVDVKLKGTGFKKDSSITIKLNGNIDYDLKAKYVDSETYNVEVPVSVAVGTYDVEISIDGKKKIIDNGFSIIAEGDEKKTVFGPYVFTSAEKISNGDDDITLRGHVVMNGWLNFKGDLHLVGDLKNGGSIRVEDTSGSYVQYDAATADGLGSLLAKWDIPLDVPALQDFTLYNDPAHKYDYSNYNVDDIQVGLLKLFKLVSFDQPTIRLYPNSIGLFYKTGSTLLPYQDKILDFCGTELPFSFEFEGSAQITDKNVGLIIDASVDAGDDAPVKTINLMGTPFGFSGELEVKLDTLKMEFSLGGMVYFKFLDDSSSGVGAEIAWSGHLYPDSVKLKLKLNKGIKLKAGPIPLEINNFAFGVSDLNTVVEEGAWYSVVLEGACDISCGKVKEYFPKLGKFLGDFSFFEMPETTGRFRLWPTMIELKANLTFLEEIKLAEAEVSLGKFPVTNSILRLDNEDVVGARAYLKKGFMWESADGRINVDVSGAGELSLHSRFMGAVYDGRYSYDVSWWFFDFGKDLNGTLAIGLYRKHDDDIEFIFRVRGQNDKGKVIGKYFYVDKNGHIGDEYGDLN